MSSKSTTPQQNESSDSEMSNVQQQYAQHTRTLSDISVGEILMKYQDDSHLLNHILVAKAQEDKRRTAIELRQAEEVRLQTKFIEYELIHRNDTPSYGQQQTNNSSNSSLFATSSFVNDTFENSLQAGMEHGTPLPDFHYNNPNLQENASIASSPSIDFVNPSNFDLYNDSNSHMMLSCSPSSDLPLFPVPSSTPKPVVESKSISKGKKKTSSPKKIHRTLSYESVMTLSDLNIRPPSASPPPPAQPLDHDKVMEALRAKLRKSSSPYQLSRPKPSPEPAPPPPNTYPTTGVLLLNLKSRRRKSSVTKRSNSSSSKQ